MANPASIVVGMDFSPCAVAALLEAIRLAKPGGGTVRAVHAIDPLVVAEMEEALGGVDPEIVRRIVSDAEAAWAAMGAERPAIAGIPLAVTIDHAVSGIVAAVREHGADLLVLGAAGHGDQPLGAGTVASGCVRKSPVDVLLIRCDRPPAASFRTIAAAVDFSPTSQRAVVEAAALARLDGATLHILHVFTPPWVHLHYRAPSPALTPRFQAEYRQALTRRLASFCEASVIDLPPDRVVHAVFDDAGIAWAHRSGIVEYAAQVQADLVVLGTRGRTSIRDFLLGSTAEKVLRESRSSVLAVKPSKVAEVADDVSEPSVASARLGA